MCAAERAAVCDLADRPAFRAALIRTAANQHRFVLTNHHIVLDGWSMPILLQEIFTSYFGQRLAAPAPYRRFVAWLADQDLLPPNRFGARCSKGSPLPRWWVLQLGRVGEAANRSGSGGHHPCPRRVGAVMPHHHQHRAAGRVGAAADVADRPVRRRVRHCGFGPARRVGRGRLDGGLDDQHGAGAGARLRDDHRRRLAGSAASAHNDTLEHEHLALNEIHRITGHDQLFDTVFVYENYPIDAAALLGVQELAITEFNSREYNHYPLSVLAFRVHELGLRVEFDTDVFDRAGIDALIQRFSPVGSHDRRSDDSGVLGRSARCRGASPAGCVGQPRGAGAGGTRPARFRNCSPHMSRAPRTRWRWAGERSWTYRELDEAAERVGASAGGRGRGQGRVCGAAVCADRRGRRRDFRGAQDRGGVSADRLGACLRRGWNSSSPMPHRPR